MKTPYDEIMKPIRTWAKDHYYTDFIASILADGEELTELIMCEDLDLIWLNDWWEGQKEVKLLGFKPIDAIRVRGIPGSMTNFEWIRNMSDEELAKYLAWVVDFGTDLSFENYIECGELREDEAADWYDWLQQEKSNG